MRDHGHPIKLVTVLVVVAMALLAGCDWPQPRGGPARTGFNPVETAIGPSTVAGLKLRWSQTVQGWNAPVVASGMALFDGHPSTPNAYSTGLVAVDADTGIQRWEAEAGTEGPPTVANGLVYVGTIANRLVALDLATGAERWSVPLENAPSYSPVVSGGLVFAASTASDYSLHAFNAATGASVWTKTGHTTGSSPAAANGLIYVNGLDGFLHALEPTTGAERWRAVGGSFSFPPAVSANTVFVGDNHVRAYDATTGAARWTTAISGGGLAVANGNVFVQDAGDLVAVDGTTGHERWRVPTNIESSLPTSEPSVANGVVYLGGWDPLLMAFDASSGARLWDAPSPRAAVSEPVVANGTVYVRSYDRVYAYSLPPAAAKITMFPTFSSDFGPVAVGATTESQVFTVTNFGAATTSTLTSRMTGARPGQYDVTNDGCAGQTLGGGGSCTLDVAFRPNRAGHQDATIEVTATNGGIVSAAVGGFGFPFTLSPGSADFGWTRLGSSSAPRVFTVTNNATNAAAPIVTLPPIPNSNFRFVDHCNGVALAGGATCTISATLVAAAQYANPWQWVSVSIDGAGSSLSGATQAMLIGYVSPWLTVEGSADLGTVALRTTRSLTMTVTNDGPSTTAAVVDSLLPMTPSFQGSISADTCKGKALAHGASCAVTVTVAPVLAGPLQAVLNLSAPNAGETVTTLNGMAG